MEEVDSLVKTTLGEIEKVLSTKTVVGEPIIIQEIGRASCRERV